MDLKSSLKLSEFNWRFFDWVSNLIEKAHFDSKKGRIIDAEEGLWKWHDISDTLFQLDDEKSPNIRNQHELKFSNSEFFGLVFRAYFRSSSWQFNKAQRISRR